MDENPIAIQLDFHKETFLIVYAVILLIIFIVYKAKKTNKYRFCFISLFALYNLFLVKFVILPIIVLFEGGIGSMYDIEGSYTQLIPFNFVSEYLEGLLGIKQIVGNVLLLVPMVFFVRFIVESNTTQKIRRKTFLICASVSISIETIQLIIDLITDYPNRVMDIDDFILNSVGILVGIIIFDLLKRNANIYQKIIKLLILKD